MHITFKPAPGDLVIAALFRPDGLHINGKVTPWDAVPDVIEYGEEAGVSTGGDPALGHTYTILPSAWVDPKPAPEPDPEADAAAALEAWRDTAGAESWQLALVLGRDRWQALETWTADDFVLSILVDKANDIPRISETVELFGWFFGLTEEQKDNLFRAAGTLRK